MATVSFFKQILVVCVGNICRSPTAAHLLRVALKDSDCVVESAGLGALEGKPIDAAALEILTEQGENPAPHEARQITAEMLAKADLILVMEKRHLQDIANAAPQVRGKTFLLGKWFGDAEIPDPFRKDKKAFEHAYGLIDKSVTAWAGKICPSRKA